MTGGTYRFLQDTRYGRVLIAETERIDRVVAAITKLHRAPAGRAGAGFGVGLAL